jgi:hypothetical protein
MHNVDSGEMVPCKAKIWAGDVMATERGLLGKSLKKMKR